MKQLTTITVATLLVFALSTGTVQADGTKNDQESKSTSKVECSSGAYGQTVNCVAEATASAKQDVIVRKDGTEIKKHQPAAASLDARTMAVAVATILTGAGGIAVKMTTKI
jgi:hypothetical protein